MMEEAEVDVIESQIFAIREIVQDLKVIFYGTNTYEVLNRIKEEIIEQKKDGALEDALYTFIVRIWLSNSKG